MKKTGYILIFALVGFISSCGPSKNQTEERITAMENRMFTSEAGFSRAGADSLIQMYRDFAAAYPNDSLSPNYLFKAASMTMNLQNGPGSIALFDQIIESYPDFEKAPLCLFFKGYVEENVLGDIDKARATYQIFIDTYPDHDFADDAQASINNLGKTPEQMIQEFEANQSGIK
ncbi:MAG: tetratricopeptide repeat protein [Bacteroidales bacterium]|nr:tetratricopeptide repeat protein [Bacteroidales bacterium]